MRLTTERLTLRQLKKSDIPDLVKHLSNLNVSRYMAPITYPYTTKDAQEYYDHCKTKSRLRPRTDYSLIIALRSTDRLIGGCGVHNIDQKDPELGYWISEDYWRKGIMSEACKRIIDYAFSKHDIEHMIIPIAIENKGSNALAKSLGARLRAVEQDRLTSKATGKTHDENVYILTKEDFYKKINAFQGT